MALRKKVTPLFMSYGYYLWLSYYIQKERRKSMNKYGFVVTRAITNYEKKIVSFIALLLVLNMVV